MSKHSVQLETNGLTGRIEVDGMDLSNVVSEVEIHARAFKGATVTLTMIPERYSKVTGDYEVGVDEKTHDALLVLGWTPPAEEAS